MILKISILDFSGIRGDVASVANKTVVDLNDLKKKTRKFEKRCQLHAIYIKPDISQTICHVTENHIT